MKKHETTGSTNHDGEIDNKAQALNRDYLALKGSKREKLAQLAPRLDELHNLGRSLRKLGKDIGVNESEVRYCLKVYRRANKPAAPENKPAQSKAATLAMVATPNEGLGILNSEPKLESAAAACAETRPAPKELQSPEAIAKEVLGLDVEPCLNGKSDAPPKTGQVKDTSAAEARIEAERKRMMQSRRKSIEEVHERVRLDMAERRRLDEITVEDWGRAVRERAKKH